LPAVDFERISFLEIRDRDGWELVTVVELLTRIIHQQRSHCNLASGLATGVKRFAAGAEFPLPHGRPGRPWVVKFELGVVHSRMTLVRKAWLGGGMKGR
jgi:hypothetical protein